MQMSKDHRCNTNERMRFETSCPLVHHGQAQTAMHPWGAKAMQDSIILPSDSASAAGVGFEVESLAVCPATAQTVMNA